MDLSLAPRRRLLVGAAAASVMWSAVAPARAIRVAAAAPDGTTAPGDGVRLVVPFPPGGVIDALAQLLAAQVGAQLPKVAIDYVDGQRGGAGAARVARAAPDGRTLLIGSVASQVMNRWSEPPPLAFDPVRDFTPITLLARAANVIVLSPASAQRLGVRSVSDLVGFARHRPGRLSYATIGIGSVGQLAGELLEQRCGVEIAHRPYTGASPALAAVLADEVDFAILSVAACADDIRAGRLHALATTLLRRSPELPAVPTLDESPPPLGLAGIDVGFWLALFGPAGMAREQVARLNAVFVAALASAPLRRELAKLKLEPAPSTPEQLGALVRTDCQRLRALDHGGAERVSSAYSPR